MSTPTNPATAETAQVIIAPPTTGTWSGTGLQQQATVQPTQLRRPWRATVRTVFQLMLALATLLPFIASGIYDDVDQAPVVVGQVLAVAAGVTRVMAAPQVEAFLKRFAPWLAAAPKA